MNVDKRKTQVEVLAPAGSLDIMMADSLSLDIENKDKEIYDLKHELIAAQIKAESSAKEIKELKSEINKYQKNIVKLETELNDSKK